MRPSGIMRLNTSPKSKANDMAKRRERLMRKRGDARRRYARNKNMIETGVRFEPDAGINFEDYASKVSSSSPPVASSCSSHPSSISALAKVSDAA